MTISNIIARARKTINISDAEADKLCNFFINDEFDGYIIASREKIVEAAKKDSRCYILQHGKLSKEINGNSKIYGVFFGIGHRKILVL